MTKTTPRIETVRAVSPSTLEIRWRGSDRKDKIELARWISDGRELLEPLARPEVFARATVAAHGGVVTWDQDTGDLAIDAVHLERLAAEQRLQVAHQG